MDGNSSSCSESFWLSCPTFADSHSLKRNAPSVISDYRPPRHHANHEGSVLRLNMLLNLLFNLTNLSCQFVVGMHLVRSVFTVYRSRRTTKLLQRLCVSEYLPLRDYDTTICTATWYPSDRWQGEAQGSIMTPYDHGKQQGQTFPNLLCSETFHSRSCSAPKIRLKNPPKASFSLKTTSGSRSTCFPNSRVVSHS